jgi:hypothetical protein
MQFYIFLIIFYTKTIQTDSIVKRQVIMNEPVSFIGLQLKLAIYL